MPGIPQYNEAEPVSHNIGDPLLKEIMKYRFYPSLIAIKKICNSGFSFSFSQVERDEIMKEINNLKTNKATQSTQSNKLWINFLIKETLVLFSLSCPKLLIGSPMIFYWLG